MTNETIQDRVERAQSQPMEITLVDSDPVVIQVYNDESDRIHTVIPESVHCSCEDHTYRGYVCKHMIGVMETPGLGDIMQESLKQHRADIESEANETRDRLDDLLFQQKQITQVFTELDVDQDMEQTNEDGMQLLQDGVEAEDAAIVEDEEAVDQSSEEARGEFESMVDKLTSAGENGGAQ